MKNGFPISSKPLCQVLFLVTFLLLVARFDALAPPSAEGAPQKTSSPKPITIRRPARASASPTITKSKAPIRSATSTPEVSVPARVFPTPLPVPVDSKIPSNLSSNLEVYAKNSTMIGGQIMLVGGSDLEACTSYVDLDIHGWCCDKPPAHYRLRAVHVDGTRAGEFNGPGTADDVITDRDNMPMVPFHSDKRAGDVRIWAEILDEENRIIKLSNAHTMKFIVPQIQVAYGEWEAAASGAPGVWQRPIYAVAETSAPGILDMTGAPVSLRIAPVAESGAIDGASTLSTARAATVRLAPWWGASQGPTSPVSAVQFWSDKRDGTRQLNAYRVEAKLDRERLLGSSRERAQ